MYVCVYIYIYQRIKLSIYNRSRCRASPKAAKWQVFLLKNHLEPISCSWNSRSGWSDPLSTCGSKFKTTFSEGHIRILWNSILPVILGPMFFSPLTLDDLGRSHNLGGFGGRGATGHGGVGRRKNGAHQLHRILGRRPGAQRGDGRAARSGRCFRHVFFWGRYAQCTSVYFNSVPVFVFWGIPTCVVIIPWPWRRPQQMDKLGVALFVFRNWVTEFRF